MCNVTETWQRMTLPLTTLDKIMLSIFAGFITISMSLWAIDPTWGHAWAIFTGMVTLVAFWRWWWLEGFHKKFRPILNLGEDVGVCLYLYGDLLISKQDGNYSITPLTVDRDT